MQQTCKNTMHNTARMSVEEIFVLIHAEWIVDSENDNLRKGQGEAFCCIIESQLDTAVLKEAGAFNPFNKTSYR